MKRADIKIGFACNNHCRFCVQGRKREVLRNKTLAEIKREIDQASADCQEIVFTGGEPTIHPDFLKLVAYAKKKRFKIIQIQTNGRMFAYYNFCKQTIKAGANEFSPALHGHISELHDFLTNAPGSFAQTTQGIKNLKALGQKIITNTVITKPNYRHLPEIARLLVQLGVEQYQFAFAHALGNAGDNFESIIPRLEIIEPFVKNGLDIGISAGKPVMTEAIPYCFMRDYEKYVAEKIIPDTKIFDFGKIDHDFTKTRRNEGKKRGPECPQCAFYQECEGPWREYPEKFGWQEFKPIERAAFKKKHIQANSNDSSRVFFSKIDAVFEFLLKENKLDAEKNKIREISRIIFDKTKECKNFPKVEFSFLLGRRQEGIRFFAHPHYLWKKFDFREAIKAVFSIFGDFYATDKVKGLLSLPFLERGELVATFGMEWLRGEKYPRLKIFFEKPIAGHALLEKAQINEILRQLGWNIEDLKLSKSCCVSVIGIDFFPNKGISLKIYSQKPLLSIRKVLAKNKKGKFLKEEKIFSGILRSKKGVLYVLLKRLNKINSQPKNKIYKIYEYGYTEKKKGLIAAEKEIKSFFYSKAGRKAWKKISRWQNFCRQKNLRVCPVSVSFENGEIGAYYYCQKKNE
jgi:MoaA/NifB/PqqE/SkfB family radical SAM enzyme